MGKNIEYGLLETKTRGANMTKFEISPYFSRKPDRAVGEVLGTLRGSRCHGNGQYGIEQLKIRGKKVPGYKTGLVIENPGSFFVTPRSNFIGTPLQQRKRKLGDML